MIRVNLYGSKTQGASSLSKGFSSKGLSGASSSTSDLEFEEVNPKKDALIHLAIILLPVLGLYVYQTQRIPSLQATLRTQQQELQTIRQEIADNSAVADEVRRFNEEKARLESQIAAIKKLSEGRMNIVKSLEAMQDSIPAKVWLNSVVLDKEKFTIRGTALTDLDISNFMEKVGGSAHLKDVELLEADQAELGGIGVVKDFSINAGLEGN